jgi:hypothetical protein
MRFSDIPTIFLSYAEDNADDNYQLLLQQNPNAQRVHGVKGFDSAHRAASVKAREIKNTPYFITVDGDNETFPEFWRLHTQDIPFHKLGFPVKDGEMPNRFVLSWNAYNPMTGLYYGNGGLKLWTHSFIDQMTTHEQTNGKIVDFCWDPTYVQLTRIYGYTRPYGSERQAFTAGFREGVKMPLVQGKPLDSAYEISQRAYPLNLQRLITWCSVGKHMEYGDASVSGALFGLWSVHVEKSVPFEDVSDLDRIREYYEVWKADFNRDEEDSQYPTDIEMRREILAKTGIDIPMFGPKQSAYIIQRTLPINNAAPFEKETWPTPLEAKF